MDENVQAEFETLERNRKFQAVYRIAKAIDGFERRLAPHIDPAKAEINWPKFEDELTSGSERVALHWIKALSTGDFPAGTVSISHVWATDGKIKEAIVCALAEFAFAGYVLDDRYLRPGKTTPGRPKASHLVTDQAPKS